MRKSPGSPEEGESDPAAPPRPPSSSDASPETASGHTYTQILKSSIVIGGSTMVDIAIGVVRTKVNALLLAPVGFGLMGLYASTLNLAQAVAGMGISSSGVREIAASAGSGSTDRLARTAAALSRISVALGLIGAIALAAFARPISMVTFGTYEYVMPTALLSLAVLLQIVSDGQRALLQGLRRIADLAMVKVVGGLLGTIAGIVLVWLLRERGIVPAFIAGAAASLLVSWWLRRRVRIEIPRLSLAEIGEDLRALLRLGAVFMASGMFAMAAAYVVRLVILRQVDLAAAGLYHSAWTIGGLYVGFVLRAMGADFYPRVVSVVRDRVLCNRVVNEQAQVSMLLAAPGIIATLTFAPLVIPLLYSAAFREAVEVLRWICLGAGLQVITWPIGFIIVAEGRRGLFFWTEFAYTAVYLGMVWVFVRSYGVDGAGMAFFASYVVHGVIVYAAASWLTGFRWSPMTGRLAIAYLATIALVFSCCHLLPLWWATAVGVGALVASTLYGARELSRLSGTSLPKAVARVLSLAGLGFLLKRVARPPKRG